MAKQEKQEGRKPTGKYRTPVVSKKHLEGKRYLIKEITDNESRSDVYTSESIISPGLVGRKFALYNGDGYEILKVKKGMTGASFGQSLSKSVSRPSMKASEAHHVVRAPDGRWAVVKSGSNRASRVFESQAEAITLAKRISKNQGTSVVVHSANGSVKGRL